MKLLLTGYEPFGGEEINPSLEAVKMFNNKRINGIDIVAEEMPVVWSKVSKSFEQAFKKHQPDYIICVGQAGGRNSIAIERVAVNFANGKDNEEQIKDESPVTKGGPAAFFSTLPYAKMNQAVKDAKIPCYVSNSAGLYLCNYLFYKVRYFIEEKKLDIPAGFVHIPYLPEQVAIKKRPEKLASMDLKLIVKALEEMINTF